MRIEGSEFGKITIDGTTYEHDVIIRLSGGVEKRRKKLSKRQYGTSHMISKAEAKFVFEKGCDAVIVAPVNKETCNCLQRPETISRRNAAA
jgi:Uncharacterized conserved protein